MLRNFLVGVFHFHTSGAHAVVAMECVMSDIWEKEQAVSGVMAIALAALIYMGIFSVPIGLIWLLFFR